MSSGISLDSEVCSPSVLMTKTLQVRRILLGMNVNDALAIHHGGVRWCKQGLRRHATSK